jgi:hypothetical protein
VCDPYADNCDELYGIHTQTLTHTHTHTLTHSLTHAHTQTHTRVHTFIQAGTAKAVIQCVTHMLGSMHANSWPAAAPAFGLLVSFLTDARPKVGGFAVAVCVFVYACVSVCVFLVVCVCIA